MTQNLKKIKSEFTRAIKLVLAVERNDVLAEAAFPAYTHRNPLIDHIFWKRLGVAEKMLATYAPQRVLDFGCGGGVFSYLIATAHSGRQIVGFDTHYEPLDKVRTYIDFPDNISFIDQNTFERTPHGSFDVIAALDVLEHVSDLEATLKDFSRLLKPGGSMIVSGPTENILYRLGRKISGKEFSGDYHRRTIYDIESSVKNCGFTLDTTVTIFSILPLFKIFTATKTPKERCGHVGRQKPSF